MREMDTQHFFSRGPPCRDRLIAFGSCLSICFLQPLLSALGLGTGGAAFFNLFFSGALISLSCCSGSRCHYQFLEDVVALLFPGMTSLWSLILRSWFCQGRLGGRYCPGMFHLFFLHSHQSLFPGLIKHKVAIFATQFPGGR